MDESDDASGLRFAVIGDCEPKPDPVFEWLPGVVTAINRMHADTPFDFVGGVGDIAHQGKRSQYEAATEHLAALDPVVHPIMGNEEQLESADRFLDYARRWNDDPDAVPDVQYAKRYGGYRFVFASPLVDGRSFTDEQLTWFEARLDRDPDRPAIGFVHAAPKGALPDGLTMPDRRFDRVLAHPALELLFHGHSHMAIHERPHVDRDDHGVAHVHVPGIERTKIGDEHVPRFPVVEIDDAGTVSLRYYDVDAGRFDPELVDTLGITPPGEV